MTVKTKTLPTAAAPRNQRTTLIIGGIIIAALLVAVVAIVVSSNVGTANAQRYASLPQSRTIDGAFVLGNPDAPFTLVEFADFGCIHCQNYKPTVNEFIEKFVATGQAKFEYRTIITAGGETTAYASRLAECAEEQRPGAFWEAYEVFYEYGRARSTYNEDMARPFADRLSLNLSELLNCTRTATQLQKDQTFAQQYGVSSTPTIMYRLGDSAPRPLPAGREINDLTLLVEAAQLQ